MNQFIASFQKINALVPDGIIGKNTLLKIKEIYKIPSNDALVHFVANTYHETGGYTVFEENLNYSAKGLAKTFPTRYADKNGNPNPLALSLAAKGAKSIANNVYANRMGNGNEASGDGWKYRGRGALQTTGRENYKKLADYTKKDLIDNPDVVATDLAFESAIFFFTSNKVWSLCTSVSDDAVKTVRRKVNGALIGIDDVLAKVKYFSAMLK